MAFGCGIFSLQLGRGVFNYFSIVRSPLGREEDETGGCKIRKMPHHEMKPRSKPERSWVFETDPWVSQRCERWILQTSACRKWRIAQGTPSCRGQARFRQAGSKRLGCFFFFFCGTSCWASSMSLLEPAKVVISMDKPRVN